MRKQQTWLTPIKDSLGGLARHTNAKMKRPMDSRLPLHVCMRSSMARGARTMQGRNRVRVAAIVARVSKRFHVRVVKFANVGNHLHLVVRLPGRGQVSRDQYAAWIRTLMALLAREVGGARRGSPLMNERGERAKFWDSKPFTRIVRGLRGYRVMDRYTLKNQLEAQGFGRDFAEAFAREHFESQIFFKTVMLRTAQKNRPQISETLPIGSQTKRRAG